MTNLILASAILAASLSAEPAKPAAPATPSKAQAVKPPEKAKPPADTTTPVTKAADAVTPEKPKSPPASPEALKDAISALLGPCSPEMAGGKVTSIEVLDGNQLNALLEKEKSTKPKAEPMQRFIKVAYEAGGKKGSSVRQVSTHFMLTTEQAQKLLGEKLCVFQE